MLHQAIMEGWWEGFQALLPVSDPQWTGGGDTPLLAAMYAFLPEETSRAMVGVLAPLSDVSRPGIDGTTPLEKAVLNNDPLLVDLLLAHGAEPALPVQGESLLTFTWGADKVPALHTRLLPLVDVTWCSSDGDTLLHTLMNQACQQEMPTPLLASRWMGLVQRGVNPHQPNARGKSAWQTVEDQEDPNWPPFVPTLRQTLHQAMVTWETEVLQAAVTVADVEPPSATNTPRARSRL